MIWIIVPDDTLYTPFHAGSSMVSYYIGFKFLSKIQYFCIFCNICDILARKVISSITFGSDYSQYPAF